MNFSGLGFFYLEPSQSLDINIWWGNGDDHGAVLAMARFHAQTSGPLPISDTGDPPAWEFTTGNCRSNMHFTLETVGDTTVTFTVPWQSYTFTVGNTGSWAGYFSFDGYTSE